MLRYSQHCAHTITSHKLVLLRKIKRETATPLQGVSAGKDIMEPQCTRTTQQHAVVNVAQLFCSKPMCALLGILVQLSRYVTL